MKALRKVPVWLLVAAGVSAVVYRFARKQNRGERVGGPISLPKSLWLNYTLLSWFVIPAELLRRFTPPLADTLQEYYDRMDLPWAIAVLMGNRDLTRRLTAEAGVPATG